MEEGNKMAKDVLHELRDISSLKSRRNNIVLIFLCFLVGIFYNKSGTSKNNYWDNCFYSDGNGSAVYAIKISTD